MMAFVTGVVTTIVQNQDRASQEYQEKVELIEEYMKFQQLPKDLKWNIRDYYFRKFREQKIFDGTPHRACHNCTAPHRTAPHRTAPHRTAPHRTAPHRTAPHRTANGR